MNDLNKQGFGYLESVSLPALAGATIAEVTLSGMAKQILGFYNVILVENVDVVDVEFYLDGDTSRTLFVPAGFSIGINDSRFQTLKWKNLHATTSTTAAKVRLLLQKYLGLFEEGQLKGAF